LHGVADLPAEADRPTTAKVTQYPSGGVTRRAGRQMLIPHWAIGLAIFAGLAAFIGFAFRQGLQVKPDRNKDPNDWSQYGGSPSDPHSSSDGGGHFS
jgi:hypothetical protein